MTTVNDGLYQYGGVPVGSNGFAGFWSGRAFFVDYDNGSVNNTGLDLNNKQKYIDTAISSAGAWDVIYVRPRVPDTAGGDPQSIIPYAAANLSIPATKYGLNIIGAAAGYGPRNPGYITTIEGDATVTDTPVITVLAPYIHIENLHIKKGGMTGKPLVLFYWGAFGSSIVGCKFNQSNGTGHGYGAVTFDTCPYGTVYRNLFDRCSIGVSLTAASSDPYSFSIENNDFIGVPGSIRADIASLSGSAEGNTKIVISHNVFGHDTPTLGYAKYIYIQDSGGGTSTGIVAGNYFGTATLVTATLMTLRGLVESGSMCAKGFLTS
jgi:hypothetical protein